MASGALREVCDTRTSRSAARRMPTDALHEVCDTRTSCSAAPRMHTDALREVCDTRTSRRGAPRMARGPGQDIADTLLCVGCQAMAAIGCLSLFKSSLHSRASTASFPRSLATSGPSPTSFDGYSSPSSTAHLWSTKQIESERREDTKGDGTFPRLLPYIPSRLRVFLFNSPGDAADSTCSVP
jgi:hypothetical protein